MNTTTSKNTNIQTFSMARGGSFSCLFQPFDLHELYDEIAIDRVSKKMGHNHKPTVYKKLRHVDFFLQNEIQLLHTLNQQHALSSNRIFYEHHTTFLHTFLTFSYVQLADIDRIPLSSQELNPSHKYGLFYYNSKQFNSPKLVTYLHSITSGGSMGTLTKRTLYSTLIQTFTQSLNACIYLALNEIVHLGLTFDSLLLYHDDTIEGCGFRTLFTNNQYSFFVNTLRSSRADFLPSVLVHASQQLGSLMYPIEHALLVYLHTHNLSSLSPYHLDAIVDSFFDKGAFRKLPDSFLLGLRQQSHQILAQYVNAPVLSIAENILKHWQTWNLYSLSMIYLHILLMLFPEPVFKQGFFCGWLKLLLGSIQPAVAKRKSPEEILQLFSKLCYNNTLTDFSLLF
jgi:hypothetical protein